MGISYIDTYDSNQYWHDTEDDHFKVHNKSWDWEFEDVMRTIGGVIAGIVLLVLLIWLFKRCCCQGSRGQIIAGPPPIPDASVYPQQQYGPAHNVCQSPPTFGVPVLPQHGAPYPTVGTPYPTMGAPYPTTEAPYPTAGAPYPNTGAPYPTGVTQYPPAHTYAPPYAMPTPHYPGAPNAPDPHALPPSYDQAVAPEKSTPYNPNHPH